MRLINNLPFSQVIVNLIILGIVLVIGGVHLVITISPIDRKCQQSSWIIVFLLRTNVVANDNRLVSDVITASIPLAGTTPGKNTVKFTPVDNRFLNRVVFRGVVFRILLNWSISVRTCGQIISTGGLQSYILQSHWFVGGQGWGQGWGHGWGHGLGWWHFTIGPHLLWWEL